ncbi:MAG: hypothetical protein M1829_003805 [Trizodia sp. TS-e1964]|nr:MAG: hypothetical protein M1829_003805 [Trizodia sp. TS-e1964]
MAIDPLSPIAPARVRALVLPLGRIKRARFSGFLERLQVESCVRLGDVSPDGRPNRVMFSPLAFPSGSILYNLSSSLPTPSQISISPFELFREPLLVLAIADAFEVFSESAEDDIEVELKLAEKKNLHQLVEELEDLREQYPKALIHRLLLFDCARPKHGVEVPEGVFVVPRPEHSKTTTLKTIMCDITSQLLAEMTTFAKSLQGLPSIESPSSSQNARINGGLKRYSPSLARRNSQQSNNSPDSRSGSPADLESKNRVRMSMPVPPISNIVDNASSADGLYGSLLASRPESPPPTTFDAMTPAKDLGVASLISNPVSRSSAGTAMRDSSPGRIAVQGFGSGSLSERARNKGKGRIGIVVGSLYLQAGRWPDAIKELVESTTIAKTNSDHLWHAKGLENILVAMLMLTWARLDFTIPQICFPLADIKPSSFPNQVPFPKVLTGLIPELMQLILNLYARATNFTGESLPQLPFSETIIRFSKLLAAVHLSNGTLDETVMKALVNNMPFPNAPKLTMPHPTISPNRVEIVAMLCQASILQNSSTAISIADRTIILGGIASVLSSLGLHRKKAFIMRELVLSLIPGLIQARKVGAAELGVHPAAGLATLNSFGNTSETATILNVDEDLESGTGKLLNVLGGVYGVLDSSLAEEYNDNSDVDSRLHGGLGPGTCLSHSNESIIARTLQNDTLSSFGNINLKMDVLTTCINLCEALPNLKGVLYFTTELLRTAGHGVGQSGNDNRTGLAREEQIRLATNISRTVNAAKTIGLLDVEAEYWDDFLVRRIEVVELPSWRIPIPHAKNELDGTIAVSEHKKEKTPFIYNSFLKKPEIAQVKKLLIAGEVSEFKITLQNPFDFDIEIEKLRLESEGVGFESTGSPVVIGPYRVQTVFAAGKSTLAGPLCIHGCIIKVKSCRERRFPTFNSVWIPEHNPKVKLFGLAASRHKPSVSITKATLPIGSKSLSIPLGPTPSSLDLTVIAPQPLVSVKEISIAQSAMMILDGEVKVFSIALQNMSSTTPIDLVLFSFQDSTTAPLQAAMANNDITPADLYELELLYSKKQPFRWRHGDLPHIAAGQTSRFEVEVLGQPGLTNGTIQIDYGHLGVPKNEVDGIFYTRKIILPVTITVNSSIDLLRADFLPFSANFFSQNYHPDGDRAAFQNPTLDDERKGRFENLFDKLRHPSSTKDYCLMLLDFRNAWPYSINVTVTVKDPIMPLQSSGKAKGSESYSTTELLQPGHTSRLILPLPRILLKNPHAAIPVLNPANRRQFVVSASKITPEMEKSNREAFWFREEVLKLISATWVERGANRSGVVELRSLRLAGRMIDAIRVEEVGIESTVVSANAGDSKSSRKSPIVRQVGHAKFEVEVDEFLVLKTRVHNRTSAPIYPLVRLQPWLRNQPHNIALDLSKRFAWSGLLQRTLPLLLPGQSAELETEVMALCRGEFEVGATIEEVKLWKPEDSAVAQDGEAGLSAESEKARLVMDPVLGNAERRIWHATEACVLIARDRPPDTPLNKNYAQGYNY